MCKNIEFNIYFTRKKLLGYEANQYFYENPHKVDIEINKNHVLTGTASSASTFPTVKLTWTLSVKLFMR